MKGALHMAGRQDETERKLDDIDRKLIAELEIDARVSNVELAKRVDLTEGAVRRRIDNLMKSKALRIIGAVDPRQLGLTTHAVIGMRVEQKRIEGVLNDLSTMPQFSWVYQTLGQFDVVGVAFFATDAALGDFLTNTLAQVDGVRETQTFLIMNTAKRSYHFGEVSIAPSESS
jgi:Lrp/AsnC family transcriptional regulator for asnA, asnC and gidA